MASELPSIGKISPEAFHAHVYPYLGAHNTNILAGPQSGVDIGITRIAPGTVMATTTDPVFVVPDYGWQRAAWFAAHILASDAATSGLPSTLMTVDLNLPLSLSTEDFGMLWQHFAKSCEDMGISIVSGHTARYQGCDYPMIGGATVMSIGPEDGYVTAGMARPGDILLCTKGAAIETTGLFAATFPAYIQRHLGLDTYQAANALFDKMSVVEDARIAARAGVREYGVTAMHDATECGVVGGVYEIAEASGVGVILLDDQILIRPEVRAVTELVSIDPLISISEGTLLLAVAPYRTDVVIQALAEHGIDTQIIGEMTDINQGMWREGKGIRKPLVHPRVDPFWEAFGRTLAKEA